MQLGSGLKYHVRSLGGPLQTPCVSALVSYSLSCIMFLTDVDLDRMGPLANLRRQHAACYLILLMVPKLPPCRRKGDRRINVSCMSSLLPVSCSHCCQVGVPIFLSLYNLNTIAVRLMTNISHFTHIMS